MGHESYVCGFIKVADREAAAAALSRLPNSSADDTWPYLTASMFGISATPLYRDYVVHFGASYKDILGGWTDWEEKLERLLTALDFVEAKLIVEDCYRGDFLVAWVRENTKEGPAVRRIHRYLDYADEPEVTLD